MTTPSACSMSGSQSGFATSILVEESARTMASASGVEGRNLAEWLLLNLLRRSLTRRIGTAKITVK